ncbi:MAG: carbamoyltransferase HypF [Planctomycetota bacterium]
MIEVAGLLERLQIRVTGQVQGVGFRPFVWNRATDLLLAGFVRNDSSGVAIEIQGNASSTLAFLEGFEAAAPPLASIHRMEVSVAPVVEGETGFVIGTSSAAGRRTTPTTPDTGICDDCLRELADENDRRFGYPFINCTNCGPRFTIVERLPYDRPHTTMKSFVMCAACQQEYDDPSDRRFHAQPNACPQCGPKVWYTDRADDVAERPPHGVGDTAAQIGHFASAIDRGAIVAVKGIGGFHLACDAGNAHAVRLLRDRKGRGDKPLAMLVGSVEQAERLGVVSPAERRLLTCRERPIVLLRKREDSAHAVMLASVAPGNGFVGVMLPYSPLHVLLSRAHSPLVMTSGNLSDEPIARTNREAAERLSGLADGFLLHDREIFTVCDDSVVRRVGERLMPIRRSRGYAPIPIALPESGPAVLAVGGELKAAISMCVDRYAYVGQHTGDVGNLETVEALRRGVEHYLRLYEAEPAAIAADLHPGYLSRQFAQTLAGELKVPLIGVQHHQAHAASLATESAWDQTIPLLVCCFDGTGYGLDGAIWGSEFFLLDGQRIQRVAHLRYFQLPGGDASIKRPYRAALALLRETDQPWDERLACVAACPAEERAVLAQQLAKGINCVPTSSAGRLFDAAAALIGVRQRVDYEAQAAMELEALAEGGFTTAPDPAYAFALTTGSPMEIDPKPTIAALCRDSPAGRPLEQMAAQFHHAVAGMVVAVGERMRVEHGCTALGLTGGVFQNALLTELVEARCRRVGLATVTHSVVPPNDGGLSLGQAVLARGELARGG